MRDAFWGLPRTLSCVRVRSICVRRFCTTACARRASSCNVASFASFSVISATCFLHRSCQGRRRTHTGGGDGVLSLIGAVVSC